MVSWLLLTAVLLPAQAESSLPGVPATPAQTIVAPVLTSQPTPAQQPKVPTQLAAPVPPPERFGLMKELQGTWLGAVLDDNRLNVTGWVDASDNASSDERSNLPIGFDYRANRFLLQQNWVRFERRVVDRGTSEPTWGFLSDWILPGADYFFTLPRGIFNGQLTANHGQPNLYGIDPIQFYLQASFPTVGYGLDLKLGRFFTQYGFEVIASPVNWLFSHAYAFLYDPFTQTGLLATQHLNPNLAVQAGITLGDDIFIDPADKPTGIFSVRWAPPNGPDNVVFSSIIGPGRFDRVHNFNNLNVFDLVWQHKVNTVLNYTFETLYGYQSNVPGLGFCNWFSILNYANYAFSPQASWVSRLEFFDDAQGQRTGFQGLYTALTSGLNVRPWGNNVILRPELRYDYNSRSRPFEGKHGLFTAVMDVVVRW